MDFFSVIVRFFQDGGPFMFPIAVVLAFGLAIALERYLVLTAAAKQNARALTQIRPLLQKGDYAAIIQHAENDKAALASIYASGLIRLELSPRREDIEYAMEEGIMEAMPRLEKRTPYLATLANIATLLGLLGTIIGLISAFSAIANANPAEKATLLSQSISVAMHTTAFGLIAAIPLLLSHSVLQTKTTDIIEGLERAGVKLLNTLTANHNVSPKTRSTD